MSQSTSIKTSDDRAGSETLNRLRAAGIAIFNSSGIALYLSSHPGLDETLSLLCVDLRARFPIPTELALTLYRDPEISEQYLTLFVRPTRYADGLAEEIEAFTVDHEEMLSSLG